MHKNLRMFLFLVFFVALSGLAQANDHGRGHANTIAMTMTIAAESITAIMTATKCGIGITSTIATIACRLV